MRILVDADGCPVTDIVLAQARRRQMECILFCDTAHRMEREGARTVTVSRGADSADFALVNALEPGDVVVTQDYGLAAMALSRQARPISQDGMRYTLDNIDALLLSRHTAWKIRRGGGRLKGPSKRTHQQDSRFEAELMRLLDEQP